MGLRKYFDTEKEKSYAFVSDRFKGSFLIKGVTEEDIFNIKAASEREYLYGVIKLGVIEPEIDDEGIRLLLPGEIYSLYNKIIKISGLDKSFSELKRQVGRLLLKGDAETVYCCIVCFEMCILPTEFLSLDIKERACIAAFIDEKIRLRKRGKARWR